MVFIVKQSSCIPNNEKTLQPSIFVDDETILQLLNSEDIRELLLEELSKDAVVVGRLGIKCNEDMYYKGIDKKSYLEDVLREIKTGKEYGYYCKL